MALVRNGLMGELKTKFKNSWAKAHPIRDDPNLRPLFEPIIEHNHKATCFHGSATAVKIQGSNGVFGSIYFKRCHGLYVNALDERLETNNVDVEDEIDKKVDDMELKARRVKRRVGSWRRPLGRSGFDETEGP
jgi:hypothetical protein